MTHKRVRNPISWIQRAKWDIEHEKELTEQLIKNVAEIRKKKKEEEK